MSNGKDLVEGKIDELAGKAFEPPKIQRLRRMSQDLQHRAGTLRALLETLLGQAHNYGTAGLLGGTRLRRKEDYNGGVYSVKVQGYILYKRFCLEGVCGSE